MIPEIQQIGENWGHSIVDKFEKTLDHLDDEE
jgi:hypothetical protein